MKPTEEQCKDIAETYLKGVTLAVLAGQFGVSIPTVTKWVKKGGATIRSRGQRKKDRVQVNAVVIPNATTFVNVAHETVVTDKVVVPESQIPRQIFSME